MSDQLGWTPSGDAVRRLLDGHRGMRSCLALVRRIADGRLGTPQAVEEAAHRVERFFTRKFPLHVHDEEESVAPRLYGREPEVDAALEAMARDHGDQQRPLAVIVTVCKEIARVPAQLPRLAPYLREALDRVERLLARHFAREEGIVYPAIRRLLDESAEAQIVMEMAARRTGIDSG
jgi:hemerythrin-like domain-containing protein